MVKIKTRGEMLILSIRIVQEVGYVISFAVGLIQISVLFELSSQEGNWTPRLGCREITGEIEYFHSFYAFHMKSLSDH